MEPRTRTILLLLLGSALTLGAGCVYLAVKAYNAFMEKPSQAEKPVLYARPQLLHLKPCEAEPGATLTYFGFNIGVPWPDVEDRSESAFYTHVTFGSGYSIGLSPVQEFQQPTSAFRKQDPQTRKVMEELYGREAIESNYGYYKTVLNMTPDDLDSAGSLQKMMVVRMMLLMKETLARGGETGIYSFDTDLARGFQFGDPARLDSINLALFDRSDRQLNLWLGTIDPSEAPISQEHLNCIVQSIRPAEEPRE